MLVIETPRLIAAARRASASWRCRTVVAQAQPQRRRRRVRGCGSRSARASAVEPFEVDAELRWMELEAEAQQCRRLYALERPPRPRAVVALTDVEPVRRQPRRENRPQVLADERKARAAAPRPARFRTPAASMPAAARCTAPGLAAREHVGRWRSPAPAGNAIESPIDPGAVSREPRDVPRGANVPADRIRSCAQCWALTPNMVPSTASTRIRAWG